MSSVQKTNKVHNPFKTIVSRIAFFIKQNNVEIPALLKRLGTSIECSKMMGDGMGIPNDGFAAFLKQKVEKKRDLMELRTYTKMIDINKDSYITAPDLETCIRNLNNAAFWRNNGEAVATSSFTNKVSAFPK